MMIDEIREDASNICTCIPGGHHQQFYLCLPYNSLFPTPAMLALLLVEATLAFLMPPPSSSAPDDEEPAAAAAGVLAAAAAVASELKMAGAESP